MIELLSTLTITQALIYLTLFAIAAKEVIVIKDFFKKKVDDKYDSENNEKRQIEDILKEVKSLSEKIAKQQQEYEKLRSDIQEFSAYWEQKDRESQEILQMLIKSDMDSIKSFIVKEHHHFIEEQWIDDFSLDTIEKRYSHYKAEGGNSYVTDLMKDLRSLPNSPRKSNE